MNKYYRSKPIKYTEQKTAPKRKAVPAEVFISDDKFCLEFLSGSLEGRVERIEISQHEYDAVLGGDLDIENLIQKYST